MKMKKSKTVGRLISFNEADAQRRVIEAMEAELYKRNAKFRAIVAARTELEQNHQYTKNHIAKATIVDSGVIKSKLTSITVNNESRQVNYRGWTMGFQFVKEFVTRAHIRRSMPNVKIAMVSKLK